MADHVRIIGGSWRGRWLEVADLPGLRPTGDRVRETLFNWLQNDISGSVCLDLFAGSGALGFEAASRGAREVHLVEQNSVVAGQLGKQIEQFSSDASATDERYDNNALVSVHCADTQMILAGKPSARVEGGLPAADIVFVDPPFTSQLQSDVLQALHKNGWLRPQGLVYIEMERGELQSILPENWAIHRESSAARVTFGLVYPGC